MSQSPSKRQRTSIDTFLPRGNGENAVSAPSNPTTPTRRASYLSPTKASLARSHPKLLLKSPGRNRPESRSRRRTINNQGEEPNGATAIQQSAAELLHQYTKNPQLQHTGQPQPQGSQDSLNLAATIAQLFRDVPSATNVDNDNENVILPQPQTGRKPLSPRQPGATSNPDRLRKNFNDEQVESILPRLVKLPIDSTRLTQNSIMDGVDLPPTPVQLGLSQAPYRPRGLASSSSGGSKSGSGRNRMRVRNNEGRSITSSPLKPRDRQPGQSTTVPAQMAEVDADEAAESEEDEMPSPSLANVSSEAKQKLAELSELRNILASLHRDIGNLEALSETLKADELIEIEGDLKSILADNEQPPHRDQDTLEAHPSFVKDPEAFLKLFAPANLQLLHSTRIKMVRKRPKVIHTLSVTAPKPWLPAAMQLTFDVTIDTESASIDSISQIKPGFLRSHSVLQTWLDDRLSDPLHRHDIAGLIIGAGHYFDACVRRASIFHDLVVAYKGKTIKSPKKQPIKKITAKRVIALSEYLETSQLAFTLPAKAMTHSEVSKQILFEYELRLSWTGSVYAIRTIACSGIGPQAQREAKDLFQKLLYTEGPYMAFASIWKLISQVDNSEDIGKHRAQPRKARKRVVI